MGAPYILGALYPPDDVVPKYTQPGGPGTAALPSQPIGERMGLFSAPCLHWFNSWRVQEASYTDPNTQIIHRVALVQCPLCGCLAQIIDPYSLIDFDPNYWYIIG